MRLFMIFIALVISLAAGIAFWLVNSKSEPYEAPIVAEPGVTAAPQVQEQLVLIARQDIPVGKVLDENDIDRQTWPANLVIENFILDGQESTIVNQVARTAFQKGQPLIRSYIANKDDPGFLAAQLPEGMRAVTIAIDEFSGVNGFIFPGDRVDVIVKHAIGLEQDYLSAAEAEATAEESGQTQIPTTVQRLPQETALKVPLLMNQSKREQRPVLNVTEVLVPNARVMAVGFLPTDYETTQRTPTSITLEVTDLQAQMIRHADERTLTLALRSLKDAEKYAMPRPVSDTDMTSLTPPSYFPHLYDKGQYAVETHTLEGGEYPYSAENPLSESEKVVIIRGVEKETVGVTQ
jgi:Flp pilus assembly protein CpaB